MLSLTCHAAIWRWRRWTQVSEVREPVPLNDEPQLSSSLNQKLISLHFRQASHLQYFPSWSLSDKITVTLQHKNIQQGSQGIFMSLPVIWDYWIIICKTNSVWSANKWFCSLSAPVWMIHWKELTQTNDLLTNYCLSNISTVLFKSLGSVDLFCQQGWIKLIKRDKDIYNVTKYLYFK